MQHDHDWYVIEGFDVRFSLSVDSKLARPWYLEGQHALIRFTQHALLLIVPQRQSLFAQSDDLILGSRGSLLAGARPQAR
ncbi:hypothetical protein D3C85_1863490 [compost metagenome]